MKLLLPSFFFIFLSCTSQETINSEQEIQVQATKISSKDSLRKTVYAEIKNLIPDSSFNPKTYMELGIYLRSFYPGFGDYCKKKRDSLIKIGNDPSLNIALEEATILMDDFQQYLGYKLVLASPKTEVMMTLLGDASPYSQNVSIKDRLEFFKTFPTNVQESDAGKKTWNKLANYSSFNIGKNIFIDKVSFVYNSADEKLQVSNLFSKRKSTLLIFGASWCSPCVRDEIKLKNNYYKIDTSKIQVVVLSIEKKKEDWFRYVSKHSFPWNTYVLEGETDNAICEFLNVTGVPKCFLVNEKGVIIKEHINPEFTL